MNVASFMKNSCNHSATRLGQKISRATSNIEQQTRKEGSNAGEKGHNYMLLHLCYSPARDQDIDEREISRNKNGTLTNQKVLNRIESLWQSSPCHPINSSSSALATRKSVSRLLRSFGLIGDASFYDRLMRSLLSREMSLNRISRQ